MMREEEHLCLLGQFSQHLESCRRPIAIKVDEQIVGNERQRICTIQIIFYGSDT